MHSVAPILTSQIQLFKSRPRGAPALAESSASHDCVHLGGNRAARRCLLSCVDMQVCTQARKLAATCKRSALPHGTIASWHNWMPWFPWYWTKVALTGAGDWMHCPVFQCWSMLGYAVVFLSLYSSWLPYLGPCLEQFSLKFIKNLLVSCSVSPVTDWLTVRKRTKVCGWRGSASGGLGRCIGWQRQAQQDRALVIRHRTLLATHILHLFPSFTEEALKCAFEVWCRWRDSGCAVIKDLWLCLPPWGAMENELSSHAGRGPEEEARGAHLIPIPFAHWGLPREIYQITGGGGEEEIYEIPEKGLVF